MEATESQILDINYLHHLSDPPPLFEPGEALFWNDPYISVKMLDFHLNPDTDAASRRPEFIDAIMNWLLEYLRLEPGAAWLDLGCGPGLYTSRLARHNLRVTGMDYSQNSIAYARGFAAEHNLHVEYLYQNYLTLGDAAQYDVISLIYGDLCPLLPEDRAALLDRVYRALKPGGRFVFDVTTPVHHEKPGTQGGWSATPEDGFWRPGPHLVLDRRFSYPDDVFLDQHIVIEADGTSTVYRFWYQDFTPARIMELLAQHGFVVRGYWADLAGTAYTPESDWLAVVAERV